MRFFRATCTLQVQVAAGIPSVRLRCWNRRDMAGLSHRQVAHRDVMNQVSPLETSPGRFRQPCRRRL